MSASNDDEVIGEVERQETRPNLSAGRRIRRPAPRGALSIETVIMTVIMAGKLGAARRFVNGRTGRGAHTKLCGSMSISTLRLPVARGAPAIQART